ncbi:hypothetical protein BASA83_003235 [Batrachochytrium salamandrivorans]|nr:hypothetical protein BASA83_003235 [Batrachochytrium salamandrivorans]
MPTALTHSYWADVDSDSDLDDIDDIDAIAVAIAEANSCLLHVNAVPGGSALDPARNTAAAATLHDAPSNTIVVTSPDTNVNAAPVALHSLAGLVTDPSISTSTSTLASQSIDSIISPLISPLVSSFISPFVSPHY